MADNVNIPPSDVLAQICADTRAAVAKAKSRTSVETLRYEIGMRKDTTRGFGSALKEAVAVARIVGLVAIAAPMVALEAANAVPIAGWAVKGTIARQEAAALEAAH